MRNMTSTSLCPVCREGLWREFLKRVDLIDNVTATCEGEGDVVRLTLATLPLGKWRTVGQAPPGEALSIEWMNEGRVVSEFSNTATVLLDGSRPKHGWTVRVRLVSSEIRKIDARLVVSERKAVLPECFARTAFVMQV